jgi:hypothetical protein
VNPKFALSVAQGEANFGFAALAHLPPLSRDLTRRRSTLVENTWSQKDVMIP